MATANQIILRESTHRASAGRASAFRWMDGSFYLPAVGLIVVSMMVFFGLMFVSGGRSVVPCLFVCSLPTFGLMTYVLVFRRNKPPGWDRDLIKTIQFGRDFEPPRFPLRHPLAD